MNIAVFSSHEGTDLQAIIDGCKSGKINSNVCAVISNNAEARSLERAKSERIDSYFIDYKNGDTLDQIDKKICDILKKHHTDVVFLAGYLKKIGPMVLDEYDNRIFNIHPALLPQFGGKGMYGMNVHRTVIEAHEKVSGITIHRVNKEYDSGDIVAQTKVEVFAEDTSEQLAKRVLQREHTFIVEVLSDIVNGYIKIG